MSQLVFDENIARQMETLYRTRDVRRRRALVREALGVRAGERVLDVGCGPGFYAEELLAEVGPEGAVVGVDASAADARGGGPALRALRQRRLPRGRRDRAAGRGGELRRRALRAGARVRRRRDGRAGADAPCAASRRARRRVGRRLGDAELALRGPRAHGARAARLGRAPHASRRCRARWRRVCARRASSRSAPRGMSSPRPTLDPEAFGTGVVLTMVEQFAAGRPSVGPAEAAAWAAEQRDARCARRALLRVHPVLLHRGPRALAAGAAPTRWSAWSSCRARSGRTP